MMNKVMARPLFRQSGSPMIGERSAELRSIIEDIRANEGMRDVIGSKEADNVSRQLGDLLRVPFEEFQGKYVRNPMSGEMEPMSGPLTGTPKVDPTFIGETVMVIDRRPNSETFGQKITVPRNTDTYEMIRSGMFEFNEIAGMAEGGEMESDAVGIADGLDREEEKIVDREPSNIVHMGDGTLQKRIEQGQCPRCDVQTHIIERDGSMHCSVCGLVVGER